MHKKKKGIEQDPSYKLVSSPESKHLGKVKKLKVKNTIEDQKSIEQKIEFKNQKIMGKINEDIP